MSVWSSRWRAPALGVAILLALVAATAGVKPAKSATGSPGTKPHESYFYTSCNSSPCRRQMYRVPDNQQLKVFALSCGARVRAPGQVSHIGFLRQRVGGGEDVVELSANRVGVQGETQYFSVQAGPDNIVSAGDTVDAFVNSTAEVDAFYCFMAGALSDTQ